KKLLFVSVTTVALLLAAPPGYWDQMLTSLSPTEDYNWKSQTGRKEVFLRGTGYMRASPVTGIAADNCPRAEGMRSGRAEAREYDPGLPGIKWSAAHNSFLQAAAEMGVPGLLLFCVMIYMGGMTAFRLRKKMVGWENGDPEQRFMFFTALYLPVAF